MIKVKMYSIYDSVNGSYGPINMFNNDSVAIRDARINVAQNCQLQAMARDLALYCVGEFDAHTGVIIPCDKKLIVNFSDLLEVKDGQ